MTEYESLSLRLLNEILIAQLRLVHIAHATNQNSPLHPDDTYTTDRDRQAELVNHVMALLPE